MSNRKPHTEGSKATAEKVQWRHLVQRAGSDYRDKCKMVNGGGCKLRQISLGQPFFRQENGRQIPNGRWRPSSTWGASRADHDGTPLEPAPMDE
jgi:hypothetical protein